MTHYKRRTSLISFVLIAVLLTIGCGSTPSALVTALEAISIAADVGAPVVAAISPQAAAWINLVPGVITAALGVVEGTTPLATTSTVIAQLQSVWQQGQQLLPNLPPNEKTLISGILGALQAGITLYQQQYPPTVASAKIHVAYAAGFVDSPNPKKAKIKKLGKSDKDALARIKAHLANIQSAASRARH